MSHKIVTQAPTTLTNLGRIVKALHLMMDDPEYGPDLRRTGSWAATATSVRVEARGLGNSWEGTYYYLAYEQHRAELKRMVDSMYQRDNRLLAFEQRLVQYYQASEIVEALASQGIQCDIRPQIGKIEILPQLNVAALGAIQSRI